MVPAARARARAIPSDVYRSLDPVAARKPKPGVPTFRRILHEDYPFWAKADQTSLAQNLRRLVTLFNPLLDERLEKIKVADVER